MQSFPDRFEFTGTVSSRCRQIGNAVPPLLAQHLAYALAKALDPESKPKKPRRVTSVLAEPAPVPDEESRERMKRQPRKGTKPETVLFEGLVARGLNFERNVKPVEGLRREADGCLPSVKIAVFVDGCFWHGCPEHQVIPRSNRDYWVPKLRRNIDRDRGVDEVLTDAGWQVIRIWEHEDAEEAGNRVERAIQRSSSSG